MVFSNADEEIKKYEKIKELCEEINTVEADKLFLSKEQLWKKQRKSVYLSAQE